MCNLFMFEFIHDVTDYILPSVNLNWSKILEEVLKRTNLIQEQSEKIEEQTTTNIEQNRLCRLLLTSF